MRNIELTNNSLQLVYTSSIFPLPSILPVTFNKSILAIYLATNIPLDSKWEFGGYLTRVINIDGNNYYLSENKKLLLGRNIVLFEKITVNYQIKISIPEYFKSVELSVFQYEGIDNNT